MSLELFIELNWLFLLKSITQVNTTKVAEVTYLVKINFAFVVESKL
jgi:hypothetical protein